MTDINITTENYELSFDGPVVFMTADMTNYYTKSEADTKFQDKSIKVNNVEVAVSSWVSDATYEAYPYAAEISVTGATSGQMSTVVFDVDDAISGNFAPVSETESGKVKIWAKEVPADAITIPTIILL